MELDDVGGNHLGYACLRNPCGWFRDPTGVYRLVAFGVNGPLPALKGIDPDGQIVSIPFKSSVIRRPTMYKGDFYVDEFTKRQDQGEMEREIGQRPRGHQEVDQGCSRPVTAQFRNTGKVDPRGKIDPHGEVNLSEIRRPAFFGQPPYDA